VIFVDEMNSLGLRLAGRALRQPEVRPANVTMDWIPEDGKRSRKGPEKKLAYDICRIFLQGIEMTWRGAKRVASDRQRWRNPVVRRSVGWAAGRASGL